MTSDEAIDMLDRSLASRGQKITLRRLAGSPPNQVALDAHIDAFVRSFAPHELVGGITLSDSKIVVSPTQIALAQWPGGVAVGQPVDASTPRKGDKVVIDGRVRDVMNVSPFLLADVLVRIELAVRG